MMNLFIHEITSEPTTLYWERAGREGRVGTVNHPPQTENNWTYIQGCGI